MLENEKSVRPALAKRPSLKEIFKEKEIRFFFKFVDRYDLRVQALALIEARLKERAALLN